MRRICGGSVKKERDRIMRKVRLGKTEIVVNKNGFGALPIQRRSVEEAVPILRKAYDNGIDFFDTARAYSDSETKIGLALADVRDDIVIATKTAAKTGKEMRADLERSLEELKTDHVDIYQFHNPDFCPLPGDGSGLYEEALKAKEEGKILHIGITEHKHEIAEQAIESGLYETVQFPFSYLADETDMKVMKMAVERDMGFICMKSLSGGLIRRSDAAYAFMKDFDNVIPIWGVQWEKQLDEFLSYQENEPELDGEMLEFIEEEKKELSGAFCRGCGYCLPCPMEIKIYDCNRMSLLLRRAPVKAFTTPEWQAEMEKIDDCIECRQCASRCPYGLDVPELLKKNLEDYRTFI